MPKGFVIFTETIRDQERYENYAEKAVPTIGKSGGRAIAVQDGPEVLEGQWHGSRTVILEFDSVEAARGWYNSTGYQAVVGERHASAEANAVIVAGVEGG